MNKTFKMYFAALLFILLQAVAFASFAASPMGYWKTIDDVTGRPKGVVKIYGSSNNLSGVVVKLFPGAMTVCSNCGGNLRNKPIMGMVVLYGMKQNPNNPNEWTGGTIYDPKKGQAYNCTITVSPDGRTLSVRGYIGISLLGRSQTWIRVSGK